MTETRESPLPGQLYAEVKNWHDSATGESGTNEPITTDIEKANVITSIIEQKVTHHKLIIDLDLPAKLIPSSTPGHFHLYVDHEIEKDKYFALLKALVDAGLVESGYLGASEARGYTAVRLPWVKKEKEEVSKTVEEPRSLKLTDERREEIDGMSIEEMLREWRFAPFGHFDDAIESGYFLRVMRDKRVADPDAWVAASKALSR